MKNIIYVFWGFLSIIMNEKIFVFIKVNKIFVLKFSKKVRESVFDFLYVINIIMNFNLKNLSIKSQKWNLKY
jgi:hypothetical protein